MSERTRLTPQDFWGKIARLPRRAGCEVIERAVTLYVLLTEAAVPWWLRGSIAACLVYFIWPLDTVPDYLPGGYLDDLAAMALLMAELHVYQTPDLLRRVDDLLAGRCRRRKSWSS